MTKLKPLPHDPLLLHYEVLELRARFAWSRAALRYEGKIAMKRRKPLSARVDPGPYPRVAKTELRYRLNVARKNWQRAVAKRIERSHELGLPAGDPRLDPAPANSVDMDAVAAKAFCESLGL